MILKNDDTIQILYVEFTQFLLSTKKNCKSKWNIKIYFQCIEIQLKIPGEFIHFNSHIKKEMKWSRKSMNRKML